MSLFLIATSGRCATAALCGTLDRFSDHRVRHEPSPRLLLEAWLKHNGEEYRTRQYDKRLRSLASTRGSVVSSLLGRQRYGESWRAPNLLTDVASLAPQVRVLIVVRDPVEYVLSSYRKGAFRGERSEYDRYRLLPPGAESLPVALQIAAHWDLYNRILLDFAGQHSHTAVIKFQPMELALDSIADFLYLSIEDREGALAHLATRPNASPVDAVPPGFDKESILDIAGKTWSRVLSIREFGRPGASN